MAGSLSHETRTKVLWLIDQGYGRNQIARELGISAGAVSNIAHRERGYWFPRGRQTELATKARQIDAWTERIKKREELFNEYLNLNNRPRKERKLAIQLAKLDRHINNAMYNSNF